MSFLQKRCQVPLEAMEQWTLVDLLSAEEGGASCQIGGQESSSYYMYIYMYTCKYARVLYVTMYTFKYACIYIYLLHICIHLHV